MDNTALSDYRCCPEKYRRRHEQHLVPKQRQRGAPEFGIGVHDGLQVWFDDGGLAASKLAALASWGPDELFPKGKVKYTAPHLGKVMDGYAEAWPREDDPFEVVRNEMWVENTFLSPNELPFEWGAVLDRQILLRDDGGVYPMDTKATSMYFGRYAKHGIEHIDTFQLSTQLMGQVGLLKVEGHDVVGAYIDAIHLDTKSANPKVQPSDFLRDKVLFDDDQISQWARDVEWTMREIERIKEERGVKALWPKHDGRCFDFFRPCEYRRLCLGGDPLDTEGFTCEVWEPHKRGTEK